MGKRKCKLLRPKSVQKLRGRDGKGVAVAEKAKVAKNQKKMNFQVLPVAQKSHGGREVLEELVD